MFWRSPKAARRVALRSLPTREVVSSVLHRCRLLTINSPSSCSLISSVGSAHRAHCHVVVDMACAGTLTPSAMQNNTQATYKFRAECSTDAQAIRATLKPWLFSWNESRDYLEHLGVEYPVPDVTVEFSIESSGPTLPEIRWMMDAIDNCHVAAESVELVSLYTGERSSRRRFQGAAERPSKARLEGMQEAARVRLKVLHAEIERNQNLLKLCNTALKAPKTLSAIESAEDSPGWLAVTAGPIEGLNAIRRVCAPLGCKNLSSRGDYVVNSRVTTISG